MNTSVPPGPYLVRGVARDLEHQQGMLVEGAPRLLDVHVEKASVVRAAGRDHHVVDGSRQATEEPLECRWIRGVEGCGAQHFELARGTLKSFGAATGEYYPGPFSVR
jgi:hypothetical protein